MTDEANDIENAMATLKVAINRIDRNNRNQTINKLTNILESNNSEAMQEGFDAAIEELGESVSDNIRDGNLEFDMNQELRDDFKQRQNPKRMVRKKKDNVGGTKKSSEEANDIKRAMDTLKNALRNIDGREQKREAIVDLITILADQDVVARQAEFENAIDEKFGEQESDIIRDGNLELTSNKALSDHLKRRWHQKPMRRGKTRNIGGTKKTSKKKNKKNRSTANKKKSNRKTKKR